MSLSTSTSIHGVTVMRADQVGSTQWLALGDGVRPQAHAIYMPVWKAERIAALWAKMGAEEEAALAQVAAE